MMNVYHASFHVALVALAFFNALVVAEGRNLLRDSWGLSTGNGNGKNDGDERILKANGNKIDGSYIVVFEEWVPENALKDMAREALLETGGILKENGIVEIVHGFLADMTEEEAPALAKLPWIKYVEEDAEVRIADLTWGLDRINQRDLPLDGDKTNSNFPSGGDGAVVYVIDTGILTTHKQFGDRAYADNDYDFVTEDLRSGQDCHGHGTHCAGTVGSTAFGVAVSTNLVSVRVLGCSGSGRWSRLVQGLNKVGTDCPRGVNQAGKGHNGKRCVVSMSLGGPGTQTTVRDAVKNLKDKGVVVVAAAGNANDNACSFAPANVEEAFTVGATDSTDHRSSFSNYGTCLDIFAPGTDITSTWSTSDTAIKTISGTSMATPHVAGVAALISGEYPNLSATDVEEKILDEATSNKVTDPGNGSPNKLLFVKKNTPQPTSPPTTLSPTTPSKNPTSGPSKAPKSPTKTPTSPPTTPPPTSSPSNSHTTSSIPTPKPSEVPVEPVPAESSTLSPTRKKDKKKKNKEKNEKNKEEKEENKNDKKKEKKVKKNLFKL